MAIIVMTMLTTSACVFITFLNLMEHERAGCFTLILSCCHVEFSFFSFAAVGWSALFGCTLSCHTEMCEITVSSEH